MQKLLKIFVLGIVLFFLSTSLTFARLPSSVTKEGQTSASPMLKRVMPGVVHIINQGQLKLTEDPFLRRELLEMKMYKLLEDKPFVSMGSGVIVDAKAGLIVTNAHVVDLDKKITVMLSDGRRYEAKKLGADNKTDIALIQIVAKDLTAIPYGDSSRVNIGDFVVAIGSPFGLEQSVTSGVVSALHRSQLGIEGFENFIQTDAPINMGNSGGALVNLQGELIGINTALLSSDGGNVGIGFAIPANMVKRIVGQLSSYGEVKRGFMGVLAQNLTPDLASVFNVSGSQGAVISQIIPQSPAHKAGMQVGDVIVRINDEAIASSSDVQNIIGLLRTGEPATVEVLREGKPAKFSLKTIDPQALDKTMKLTAKPFMDGVRLMNIQEQSPYHGYFHGVGVVEVDEYSAAWISGLRPGDIIVSANHKPVTMIEQLNQISSEDQEHLLLLVLRDNATLFVVINKN